MKPGCSNDEGQRPTKVLYILYFFNKHDAIVALDLIHAFVIVVVEVVVVGAVEVVATVGAVVDADVAAPVVAFF